MRAAFTILLHVFLSGRREIVDFPMVQCNVMEEPYRSGVCASEQLGRQ
jgi:hypothetical protein